MIQGKKQVGERGHNDLDPILPFSTRGLQYFSSSPSAAPFAKNGNQDERPRRRDGRRLWLPWRLLMDLARSAARGGSLIRNLGKRLPFGGVRGPGTALPPESRRAEDPRSVASSLRSVVSATPSFRARARPEDEFQCSGDTSVKFGFPYTSTYWEEEFGCSADKVVELLEPFMIEERASKFTKIIENRIFDIVPVVEGLYDLGNVAAVCRTVEGLGIGSVHVITGDGKYKQSARTTQGSHKWLQTQYWDSTTECLSTAKESGYNIVVTDLEAAVSLDEIDWTQKTLLLFGNEHAGVSEEAKKMADQRVIIPMHGFVESFNISVAAAMALKHACDSRCRDGGRRGDLTAEQQRVLRSVYYAKHLGSRAGDVLHDLLARERRAALGAKT